ncbi:hypothetical protein NQ176_g6530 [Zarea fungicola]|uniref:Uncharacterized protein n=1 Tax=Zarea fungicola TaxID=93591 RepID=A0ACC1N3K0_9HYPO|nr:hypothetical protein NQ176_g6530 [Lecanicillium fungicola]
MNWAAHDRFVMGAAKDSSNPKPIKQIKPVAAAASLPAARGKVRTSSSATGIASPPIEKNETTSPPRQKRWATKTRTGCITCRIRRVKCDEGKPMCKRCITSGRMCDGYNKKRPAPPTPAEQSPQSETLMTDLLAFEDDDRSSIAFWTNSKAVQNSKIHDPGPALEIIPPDWDLVEAFEYFYRVILPSFISAHLEEGTSAYMPSAANLSCKTSFITFVFSNRIADVAKKRGTLRSPEDMPLDQYLWTAFHASMAKMLQIINDGLSSSDDNVVDSMLTRIADILSTDLTLQGTSWQAHLRGYGTLFKLRGGYKRLSKTVPTFPSQMQYVFL